MSAIIRQQRGTVDGRFAQDDDNNNNTATTRNPPKSLHPLLSHGLACRSDSISASFVNDVNALGYMARVMTRKCQSKSACSYRIHFLIASLLTPFDNKSKFIPLQPASLPASQMRPSPKPPLAQQTE
ncbi:uncharacterized protein UTRI_04607 [Ustilago trichophora]|uniref:Uncharacterized protein n=1 Tax=Ustilago trichophora TaxID=86804 RepID=A0A5C3EHP4_9BASI|nr:uncharacterized protein UTRI_04607 [Ustilago trichophora]